MKNLLIYSYLLLIHFNHVIFFDIGTVVDTYTIVLYTYFKYLYLVHFFENHKNTKIVQLILEWSS